MKKSEVYDLMFEIKANYAPFVVSDDEVERHFKHLKDFPLSSALKNIDAYVKTNQYPPKIADIRGKLGEQMDGEISKRQAAENEAYLIHWSLKESEPPSGYWQNIREKLRGEQHA
ncbi:hypothetical protein HQN90_17710 [Paenibacillus alba]|uniref:hypothetical protein n=1 Tax=Paenibacillus alba TaxID=1197127 RepID=UPI0015659CE8|nr:hypothetical protein [Paenibacillus alba]NQX67961.1 hypothetical protein [Paenibacillus alba]